MIFVTVGAQMPFDRLIRCVDEWAKARGRSDVLAQIGTDGWRPAHIRWTEFLDPDAFRAAARSATAIVSHAGMGTILTALEVGKPILVMPRRGELKETRNDHQVATANRLLAMGQVAVALDERELMGGLDRIDALTAGGPRRSEGLDRLIHTLRDFLTPGQAQLGTCGR